MKEICIKRCILKKRGSDEMNDLKHFNKIIKYLDKYKIPYKLTYDKTGLLIFDYPKDVRVFYSNNTTTEEYKYRISWIIWNNRDMKIEELSTQREILNILKEIVKEFGNNKHVQQKLYLGE